MEYNVQLKALGISHQSSEVVYVFMELQSIISETIFVCIQFLWKLQILPAHISFDWRVFLSSS
jgi:hypothetical protein